MEFTFSTYSLEYPSYGRKIEVSKESLHLRQKSPSMTSEVDVDGKIIPLGTNPINPLFLNSWSDEETLRKYENIGTDFGEEFSFYCCIIA